MGVAGANMQLGRFVCTSCSQKRKKTVFEFVLQSAWDFQVLVSKLLDVVFHIGKGGKFGVQRANPGQDICSRDASVGKRKNFEKQAQCS